MPPKYCKRWYSLQTVFVFLLVSITANAQNLPILNAVKRTAPFIEYNDAPNTPDVDDPAILHINNITYIISTVKDAGLALFSSSTGKVLDFAAPPNRPIVTTADPPTPAGLSSSNTPCANSHSGLAYGRYNSVADIPGTQTVVVSDRGCDRLRFYTVINEKLKDVSSGNLPRIFKTRVQFPSPFQPFEKQGLNSNPIDDQNTAYGIATWKHPSTNVLYAFVSQRARSVIKQVRIRQRNDGTFIYDDVRLFLFDPLYQLKNGNVWTACREDPMNEDPQFEGIVITKDGIMLAGFETVGIYRTNLMNLANDDTVIHIGLESLAIRVTHFGQSYRVIPDEDDEFECVYGNSTTANFEDQIYVHGNDFEKGNEIVADVEGLALIGNNYFIVSSQGDSTFHVYSIRDMNHKGGFSIFGISDTDGLDVSVRNIGKVFQGGLLVVHNGDAKFNDDCVPDKIAGYELGGATQLAFVKLVDVKNKLGL